MFYHIVKSSDFAEPSFTTSNVTNGHFHILGDSLCVDFSIFVDDDEGAFLFSKFKVPCDYKRTP